jgi:hypothetical protein
MNYPKGWSTKTALTALPGHFCVDNKPCIEAGVTQYFTQGHPLHILSRRVKLICESCSHAAMCPHNIEIEFSADDFKHVYQAVSSHGRPNIDNEVGLWARRSMLSAPEKVLRVVIDLPPTRKAIANYESEYKFKATPLSIIFELVRSCHISLDVIDAAFIEGAEHVIGRYRRAHPTLQDAAAYEDMNTWVLYLEDKLPFSQLCDVCKTRVKTTVASLCYEQFSSLPLLPTEIARMIFTFMP